MIRTIIFDLDGTLWDATGQTLSIWNEVFAQRPGISLRLTPSAFRRLMGKTMEEIGALLFPRKSITERNAIMDLCGQQEVLSLRQTGGRLYDGVEETLSTLQKEFPLMIVSNCQSGYVSAFLEAHRLGGYFCDFEESGRTGKSKSDNIRLIMERNHIDQAVYVGDTAGDQLAARRAGIPFIFAAYGFGEPLPASSAYSAAIQRFTDLPVRIHEKFACTRNM